VGVFAVCWLCHFKKVSHGVISVVIGQLSG